MQKPSNAGSRLIRYVTVMRPACPRVVCRQRACAAQPRQQARGGVTGRLAPATSATSVRGCDLSGRQRRSNFRDVFSVSATDHVGRARPTAGSDRGFARSNLFTLGLRCLVHRVLHWIEIGFDCCCELFVCSQSVGVPLNARVEPIVLLLYLFKLLPRRCDITAGFR